MKSAPIKINYIITVGGKNYFEIENVMQPLKDELTNIVVDVVQKLNVFSCKHHPKSRRFITIIYDKGDLVISLITCCYHSGIEMEQLFETFPQKVSCTFLRHLDQRELNQ